jgi:uncharacterized membrane protein
MIYLLKSGARVWIGKDYDDGIYIERSDDRIWVPKQKGNSGILLCVCTNPSPLYVTFDAEDIACLG